MPASLFKVVKDQRDLLLFRDFKPALPGSASAYLAWGMFTTWLAGIGRYWDHPYAETWQYLGLGSLGYVFVMAALIWAITLPLRPANWSYQNVLVFVMLTSLPAILYAIPVERFTTLQTAQALNMLFLGVVATWRVALLLRFLMRSAKLPFSTAFVAAFLPLVLIVTALVALNLEKAVFEIMGGLGKQTSNDEAYGVLIAITAASLLASPILLVAYAIKVTKAETAAPPP